VVSRRIAIVLLACCARTVMGTLDWKNDFVLFQKTVAPPETPPPISTLSEPGSTGSPAGRTRGTPACDRAQSALCRRVECHGARRRRAGPACAWPEHRARAAELAPMMRASNDLGTMFKAGLPPRRVSSARTRCACATTTHASPRPPLPTERLEGAMREFNATNKDDDFRARGSSWRMPMHGQQSRCRRTLDTSPFTPRTTPWRPSAKDCQRREVDRV
jgi:hypothetical protein